jgi:hypothetical protein
MMTSERAARIDDRDALRHTLTAVAAIHASPADRVVVTRPAVRLAAPFLLTALTDPGGYSGAACDRKRCDRPFREHDCGGMSEAKLVF